MEGTESPLVSGPGSLEHSLCMCSQHRQLSTFSQLKELGMEAKRVFKKTRGMHVPDPDSC